MAPWSRRASRKVGAACSASQFFTFRLLYRGALAKPQFGLKRSGFDELRRSFSRGPVAAPPIRSRTRCGRRRSSAAAAALAAAACQAAASQHAAERHERGAARPEARLPLRPRHESAHALHGGAHLRAAVPVAPVPIGRCFSRRGRQDGGGNPLTEALGAVAQRQMHERGGTPQPTHKAKTGGGALAAPSCPTPRSGRGPPCGRRATPRELRAPPRGRTCSSISRCPMSTRLGFW